MNLSPALAFVLILAPIPLRSQQVADTAFRPVVANSTYAAGTGPVVAIDEAHNNLHTAIGRYAPFAAVLRRDGYVVRSLAEPVTRSSLDGVRVLVISNALHASNLGNWVLPTPSAFTDAEIAAVREFVEQGGALLLIADHMPFAGAAQRLGAAFGLRYANGFAEDRDWSVPLMFRIRDGSLSDHPVTRGRTSDERVDSIGTFTGSAFAMDSAGVALLTFGQGVESWNPRVAWQFDSTTSRVAVTGWQQGALVRMGHGRVAAFGEAAMFTAQLAGANRQPMGMNHPAAAGNAQFALNVLRWLTGNLE